MDFYKKIITSKIATHLKIVQGVLVKLRNLIFSLESNIQKFKEEKGGKKTKHSRSKKMHKRGGGIIPQDLTNLGREIAFSTGSAYNALNGYPAPVNPAPYVQPSLLAPAIII